MMRLGVFFDGFSTTAEMLDVSRRAEEAGAHSLWFAQHMGYPTATHRAAIQRLGHCPAHRLSFAPMRQR